MAKFKISDTFFLTNRGYVLIGTIIDGAINIGDIVYITLDNDLIMLTIKNVEYVDKIKERITQIGLIIDLVLTNDYKNQLKGQIIEILDK